MPARDVAEHCEPCFCHESLFYEGDDGFLSGTLPFLREAVAMGEAALVATGNGKIEILKESLGSDAEQVFFVNMRVLGRNPARIIPAWRRFLDDYGSDGRSVRGIGEPIWSGRSSAEVTECQRHEALLNFAFDGGQAWRLLCPYDIEGLDDDVIQAAEHSHPLIVRNGTSYPSREYVDPHRSLLGHFDGDLPAPASVPCEWAFTGEDLSALRMVVFQQAIGGSLDADRTEDLVLAVNELASNSVLHGGGQGTLRIWQETDRLLCEVQDRGHITRPLVGRVRPNPDLHTGRGLWLVNHLCDLVQIRSSPSGSVVRVHMRMP